MLELDKLIIEATREGNKPKLNVFRAIKAAELEQSKAAKAKALDEVGEMQIIKKLASQHEESIELYVKLADEREAAEKERNDGKHDESIDLYRKLADEKKAELAVMKSLLPAEVSSDDIIAAVLAWAIAESNGETIPRSRMGEAIRAVKAKFPSANGKVIADAVNQRLV